MFKLAHRVTELEEMNDGPVADVNKAESLALDKIRHLSRENEKLEEVNKRLNYLRFISLSSTVYWLTTMYF